MYSIWISFFFPGYTVNSALTPEGVLYIAGQPRYNHTGQVIIYRMEGKEVQVIQRLNGEQVSMHSQHIKEI